MEAQIVNVIHSCADCAPLIPHGHKRSARQLDFMQLHKLNKRFDAIFALNCLLHVAKADLSTVLEQVKQRLQPNGLFYYGVYGGTPFEGLHSRNNPPSRFFSLHGDKEIQKMVANHFEIVEFRTIPVTDTLISHFQSMIWRRTD